MSVINKYYRKYRRKKKVLIEPIFSPSKENNLANEQSKQPISRTNSARQPATAASEKITPEKIQPKRSSIANLGVSISALTQKKEEVKTENTDRSKKLTETFTPIQLISEWKKYAESLTEEHHLKNTMLNCLPELLSREKFEVVVNNPVQEQRLLENMPTILNVLRDRLMNTEIQMFVRITVDNEKKLGFTSYEKYNLMVEQNEALKRLKDEFGLELL